MPTRDSRDRRWLLRAGSAVAVLLAGLVVLSVGGAGFLTGLFQGVGTPAETAQTAAFVIAALVPPVVLFFATGSVTDSPSARRMAGGGAILAGVSAILSGFAGGIAGLVAESPLPILLAIGYGIGTLLAFAGLLTGVSTSDPSRRRSSAEVSWQATRQSRQTRSSPGAAPADGGTSDSDLDFPLDRDREETEDEDRN